MSNYLVHASYGKTNDDVSDLIIVLHDVSENKQRFIEEINKLEHESYNVLLILVGNKGIYVPFRRTLWNESLKQQYMKIQFYDKEILTNDNWNTELKSFSFSEGTKYIYITHSSQ